VRALGFLNHENNGFFIRNTLLEKSFGLLVEASYVPGDKFHEECGELG